MVFIKRLEVRGFKSLGGKPLTLHLDRGLTVITGPNGSGKSNIIDAVMFCLGENSPKLLRVNKLTALIYDGGPQLQRPLSTRLTVTFDNQDRGIPLDANVVTVTRELRATGESVYQLNGKRTTKNTVIELLGLALISAEGLNVVPQGMVTRISELLPDEKRALIEQVVGVAQFDEKKSYAMKQLQEADVKLQVAVARIGEIKSRVEALEGERNDQLRLKQLEDEVRWLRAVVASRNILNLRRRIREQEQAIERSRRSLEELGAKLTELRDAIANLERERNVFVSTVMDGGGARHVELQFAIARASTELDRLKADSQNAQELAEKLQETIPHLRRMSGNQRAEMERLRQQIHDSTTRLSRLENAQKDAARNLHAIQKARLKLEKRLAQRRVRLERLQTQLAKRKETLGLLTSEKRALADREKMIASQKEMLEEKARIFRVTLEELEKSLNELNRLRSLEYESLNRVKMSISGLKERHAKLEDEIARSLSTLSKASDAVVRYESQRELAEQVAADEIGYAKFQELVDSGALAGVRGRFDQLFSYDPRYERAFEAVGRRWMKAVVCSDMTTALKLAELAKKLKLGRMTLIPLSDVANVRRVAVPRAEGVLGALSDFVKAADGVSGAINFVFGDTVLTDTARSAYLVAGLGFRSVTISGDVFEPKNTAFETGYFAKVRSLLDLIGDDAPFTSVKEAVGSLQGLISKRKTDLDRLAKQAGILEKERLRRSLTVAQLIAEAQSVRKLIFRYRRLGRTLEARVRRVEAAREKASTSLTKLAAREASLQARIEQMNRDTSELASSLTTEDLTRLDEQRAAFENTLQDLASQIRDVLTQLARDKAKMDHELTMAMSRLDEETRRAESSLAERTAFLETARLRIEELEKELSQLHAREKEILESTKGAQTHLEQLDEKLRIARRQEDDLRKAAASREKELAVASKALEGQREAEIRHLGELTLFGFTEPLEVFEEVDHLREQLGAEHERLRDSVNLLADRSYQDVFEGYKNLSLRRNQLEAERDAIVAFIESIEAEKKKVFMTAFEKIDREIRSIFTRLTGGSGWLEVEDPDQVFSGGVFLMTQFPGKAPRESSSVSGGEKTVSALSFILAIQSVYPSPFYLFDEIDAHLDPMNAEKLAELLRERGERSQMLVVTLKDSIVARAPVVYGVYMANGASQLVRYKPGVEVVIPYA